MDRLEIQGLMCIPPFDPEPENTRRHFAFLRTFRDQLSAASGIPLTGLSMGMSHDFEVAIAEGSTVVRVGSAIFGGRWTMLDDWQTWAAPVVVGVVLLAFSYRWWRRLRRKAAHAAACEKIFSQSWNWRVGAAFNRAEVPGVPALPSTRQPHPLNPNPSMKALTTILAVLALGTFAVNAQEKGKGKADPAAMFKKKDSNGDGKLSKEEFTKGAKKKKA
jgi:hypothetical protein